MVTVLILQFLFSTTKEIASFIKNIKKKPQQHTKLYFQLYTLI